MFGLDFGELIVIGIVFLVVLGPHELPRVMRTLGRWVGKLRRMSSDLRRQSGIDEVIRSEGLQNDIKTLRSLSRPRRLESLLGVDEIDLGGGDAAARHAPPRAKTPAADARAGTEGAVPRGAPRAIPAASKRAHEPDDEYPVLGCDAYGASYAPLATEPTNPASDPYAPDEGALPPAAPHAPTDESD